MPDAAETVNRLRDHLARRLPWLRATQAEWEKKADDPAVEVTTYVGGHCALRGRIAELEAVAALLDPPVEEPPP